MFSEHTTSRGFVNSPSINSSDTPAPRLTKQELYKKTNRFLGNRANVALEKIAYFCVQNDTSTCKVSLEVLAQEIGYCIASLKLAINDLEDIDFIEVTNFFPMKASDEEEPAQWLRNDYTVTKKAERFLITKGILTKPLTRPRQRRHANEWLRRKRIPRIAIKEEHSLKRAGRTTKCELLRQIREIDCILTAENLAAFGIKKEKRKKKGGSFSHGLEGETQDLRRRETRATPRERGENQIRGGTTDSSGTGRDEEEDPGTGRTTRHLIDQIVNNLLKLDSYTYALLPRKVENALNRGVIENVVLEKLTEISEFKIKYWSSEFDRIVAATVGKKGEPFSHEENRNENTEVTVGDRRRSGTADRQSGHRTTHRGRADTRQSRNEQDDLGANQKGVSHEQNGRVAENEPSRTEGYPPERGVPDPRSRIGSGGGVERTHEEEPRRSTPADFYSSVIQPKVTTLELMYRDVREFKQRNMMLTNKLDDFVNTLLKDEFSPAVIRRVLVEIGGTKSWKWRGLGMNFANQYHQEERRSQFSQEKAKREAAERVGRFELWDEEKRNGPKRFDFEGMTKALMKGDKHDHRGNYCTA